MTSGSRLTSDVSIVPSSTRSLHDPSDVGRHCSRGGLTMRMNDAWPRCRQSELINPHHRAPCSLTEDAPRDREIRWLGTDIYLGRNMNASDALSPIVDAIATSTKLGPSNAYCFEKNNRLSKGKTSIRTAASTSTYKPHLFLYVMPKPAIAVTTPEKITTPAHSFDRFKNTS